MFGHTHKYREHAHGQLVCTKCGQVKNGRTPRLTITHVHTWRGRKGDRNKLYCTECSATKTVR